MSKPPRKIPNEPNYRLAIDITERYRVGLELAKAQTRIFENRKIVLEALDLYFHKHKIPGFDKPKD